MLEKNAWNTRDFMFYLNTFIMLRALQKFYQLHVVQTLSELLLSKSKSYHAKSIFRHSKNASEADFSLRRRFPRPTKCFLSDFDLVLKKFHKGLNYNW